MGLSIIAKVDKKTGKISIEGDGFKGAGCLEQLNKLIENLKKNGVEVKIEKDVYKDEFYEKESVQEGIHLGR